MSPSPPPLPAWTPLARVHDSSAGVDPGELEPGRDLVLHASGAHGAALAHGVLLDDWLTREELRGIDLQANRNLDGWRKRHDEALTVESLCLPHVHEGELLADVFVREQRIFTGLRAAFRDSRPKRISLHRMDGELAAQLACLFEGLGIALVGVNDPAPAPRYPLAFSRAAGRRGAASRIRETLGAPPRPRGEVLIKPYWHLATLWRALPEAGLRPVVDLAGLPALPPRDLLGLVRRGGFVSHPGWRARRRSRSALRRCLSAWRPLAEDPLGQLVDIRARSFFASRAGDTLAQVQAFRRSFAVGRVRTAVMPSDGTPDGRIIATAAREAGVTVIQVQHGFNAGLWNLGGRPAPYVDGLVADRVAVWSERDVEASAPFARGRVVCTGNPGASAPEGVRAPRSGPTLVLLQGTGGGSVAMDARTPFRHVATAVAALAAVRPGTEVVLRPHPLDAVEYQRSVSRTGGLSVRVQRGGPIEPLLAEASLCVGALSTATLQAAVEGIPTVFLNSTGLELPWPFDASGDFPTASTAEELVDRIGEVLAADAVPGAAAAARALGLHDDSLERLVELVAEAARDARPS